MNSSLRLLDEAMRWRPIETAPKDGTVILAASAYEWQGAQITLICFDELTHFTAHQIFYLLSRNRSTCGVRPYIRATCNPDADRWVAEFLAWQIDPKTGFPIPERAGVLRYYVRVSGKIIWADPPEQLVQHLPPPETLPSDVDPPWPISVTFIPASVFDNPALLRVNPEYLAWLLSLPLVKSERLLGGNWKIRPAAGLYFKREWCAAVVPKEPTLEEDHLAKTVAAIEKISGRRPVGTRGGHSPALLRKYGYIYKSEGSADQRPYYELDDNGDNCLVNLPFHYVIDDAMFFSFAWLGSENAAQRITDPERVFDIWWAAFWQQYREGGYLTICMHPFVSGRALRVAMLDRLITRMKSLPGVWFPSCEEVARHCLEKFPPRTRLS